MIDGPASTRGPIRAALAAGRVDEAAEYLGYPWFVSGLVRQMHEDVRLARESLARSGDAFPPIESG